MVVRRLNEELDLLGGTCLVKLLCGDAMVALRGNDHAGRDLWSGRRLRLVSSISKRHYETLRCEARQGLDPGRGQDCGFA